MYKYFIKSTEFVIFLSTLYRCYRCVETLCRHERSLKLDLCFGCIRSIFAPDLHFIYKGNIIFSLLEYHNLYQVLYLLHHKWIRSGETWGILTTWLCYGDCWCLRTIFNFFEKKYLSYLFSQKCHFISTKTTSICS